MADPVQDVRMQEVYVGPRPFERSERGLFFGRDREISELLSLVISSRVVLCYAPSGAGKTSLINAGLQPRLEEEGFEVLPSTRVRGLVPEGIDQGNIPNLYVFNSLLSLAGKGGAPEELARRSLAEFLTARPHLTDEAGFPAPRILIFDQFEELLTSYPERWQEREGFFQQARDALQADSLLRVLFIIREDFLARIEPFMRLLKPFHQARFRLALLGSEGARAAVTGPLRGTGRRFKEGVVDALIEELLKVRVETAQGEAVEVVGEDVEPVQLQVVCRNLWTSLPPDVQEISPEHLKAYGDVDQALKDFYESCLAEAKASQGANELSLRQWFEQQLITPAGTRGIVFRDAKRTADLPNTIVDFLENRHLIRGEWRAGSRWYELTHDRFIEPIQRANERWRTRRQARRRLIIAWAIPLLLALVLIPYILNSLQSATQSVSATEVVAAQSTASVAEGQATQANQNATDSKSRQLAAQALLEKDSNLSLLLAVEANKQADTQEARRSLHKILSRQTFIDGEFLRKFDPEILSPRVIMHSDPLGNYIASVAFSPDGQRFVSESADANLIIWDVATGKPVFPPLSGHESNVLSVAFSPNGTLIASASLDEKVRLWDASTGQPFGSPLEGHTGLVTSVAFSPDGSRLASGGDDGTIRIWDVSKGESLAVLPPMASVWSLAWSPDGRTLASGSADSMIRLWDAGTFSDGRFSEPRLFKGHHGIVRSVAWSPDSRSLASGSVVEEGRQMWGEVILWDVASGEEVIRPLRENNQPVRTVAFDPSGTILAIGRDDGTITLWDTRSEAILGEPLKEHSHWVTSVAFSPDGRYMVSGSVDETVIIWDLFPPARSVAFSPAGDMLAASEGVLISLWDATDNTIPVTVLSGHTEDVLAIEFYSEGVFASAGRDDIIRLWDVRTGQQIEPPLIGHSDDVFTLAFSPDGKNLVSAGQDGTVILWDMEARQQQGPPLYYHPDAVIKALFDHSGKGLYLGGKDRSLVTLDLTSGESQVEALPVLQAGQRIASLAFSGDGQEVAFSRETQLPLVDDGERAHGIEISEWDKYFDPSVKSNDIDFVVVRATNGLETDFGFEEFLEPIQAVPIRGASHFFQPDQPWQDQADLFLSMVQDQGFHFFTLMIDWSSISDVRSNEFARDAEQWLKYVDERVDQKVLLETSSYGYDTWLRPYGDWTDWPLFIAQYSLEPDRNGSPVLPAGVGEWRIWQYTEKGAGYGIGSDNAVLDVYNGTVTEMWKWLEIPVFTIYDRNSGGHFDPSGLVQATSMNGIAFSPDGAYVASGSEATVSLWDSGLGNEITALSASGTTITSVRFSPDGKMLAVGTEDGTVLLWDLGLLDTSTGSEPYLELACSLVGRNFKEPEWGQFFGDAPYQKTCPDLP